MRRLLAIAIVLLGSAALLHPARAATPPRVTLIGDSVAAAVAQTPAAAHILGQRVDLNLQVAVCRRLAGDSCPYEGARPPTLVDVVSAPGANLGDTVLVAVGYNDFEQSYADNVEASLTALARAGVTHVLWVLLREQRHPYVTMNDAIRAAAAKHPELTVVDWNAYANGHADWFQDDGLHLTYSGAVAMATLCHDVLVALGIPPRAPSAALSIPPAPLGVAIVGRPYAARLHVRGGSAPYRWKLVSGALPRGLRLMRDGRLVGTPTSAARSTLVLSVRDGTGATASHRLRIVSRSR